MIGRARDRVSADRAPRPVTAHTWSPLAVASAHDVALTDRTVWIISDLVPGETYRVRALVEGGPNTSDKAALVHFETPVTGIGGTGLSVSRNLGAHLYLRTGADLHRTDRVISVGSAVRRIGLKAWGDRGRVRVKTFVIERVAELDRPSDVFLSFDVEAAPFRTSGEPIDQLVWGRMGGKLYGIPRLCDVLEQHGMIGNFMIDFVTCASRGDAVLQEIVDYVRGRGHETHLHLHPEFLDPSLGFLHNGQRVHLDRAPYALSKALLELALDRYHGSGGKAPYVFRSGGYRINDDLLRVAAELGFTAMTNVKPHTLADIVIDGDDVPYREPFVWDTGVLEIPIDVSSPEVSHFGNYTTRYKEALARKAVLPTVNVVMHSWTLLRRNSQGHHDSFAREYEDRLHAICEHTAKHGRARGYAEYLMSPPAELPVRRIEDIRIETDPPAPIRGCNICRADIDGGDCPSCGLGVGHRQLQFGFDEYGDVRVGRTVLGFNLTAAEHRAFAAGPAPVGPDGGLDEESCDCLVWLAEGPQLADPGRVVGELSRILRPGGVLVLGNRSPSGSEEAHHLLAGSLAELTATTLAVIDPVSGTTGQLGLFYKPGGRVPFERPSRTLSYLVSVRSRAAYLIRAGARLARRAVRRVVRTVRSTDPRR
jgi:hypothetical protein